jgi:hypothetical protein
MGPQEWEELVTVQLSHKVTNITSMVVKRGKLWLEVLSVDWVTL